VIAHQQLQIAKLTRQLYGQRSERTLRLLDQMELALEELESSTIEDEIAAERAVAKTTNVVALPASVLRASPSPSICGVSGWSSRARLFAFAVAARGCASWARTSPRR
jgi:Transposase C of IS166 homeodomain